MRFTLRAPVVVAASILVAADPLSAQNAATIASKGLTDVEGIKVGHFTLAERPTGCTVILTEKGAVGGVDVRGAAPGTRETDLLDPINMVQEVHAVVLSGGSAFGLDAASGVVRYLEERGIGFDTRVAKIPIVPAAILFDLGIGANPKVRPTAECGYKAAVAATDRAVEEGNVGAGAGATIGKSGGAGRAMKAGIGSAAIRLPSGLVVAALVAVNAVGDIIDPSTGQVVAGVRTADGMGLADARKLLRAGGARGGRAGENTTIGIVATNARLTKAQANKMAQMAHDGYARTITPVHTMGDGDTIFAVATGTFRARGAAPGPGAAAGDADHAGIDPREADFSLIGPLAAEVMADAIVRAARLATGIPGYPAARDLSR